MAKQKRSVRDLQLKPLKVTCTTTDCKQNLHCFRATRKMKLADEQGACRECGVQLVDWRRVHKKDMTDVVYTFEALKYEMIRHHFFHVAFDAKAINYAKRRGILGLEVAVESRLRTSVGRANDPYDGRQTPMEGSGNPIHYAQHATASCCRKCIEYWHNIPQGRELKDKEVGYLTDLIMSFLLDRFPDLTPEGEYVPSIRKA